DVVSFEFEPTHALAAHAATVLNVTQDHLDWHGSMEAYAASKARIFGPAGSEGVQVLNRHDRLTMDMARAGRSPLTFGTDPPETPGSFGILREGGMPWLVLAEADPDAEGEGKPRRRTAAEVAHA